MSGATAALGKRIADAKDLGAVVRSMKALAASSIGQYERAVAALDTWYLTVERGLSVCLRTAGALSPALEEHRVLPLAAIIVGSDQGLVGRFNEALFEFAQRQLLAAPQGVGPIWSVGERMQQLTPALTRAPEGSFPVPISVEAITTVANGILIALEKSREQGFIGEVRLFHNRPMAGPGYDPVGERLLPLDALWQSRMTRVRWPTATVPEVIGDARLTLEHLVREYLFVVLFRACAESLASENATRLAAMQRADKNIDEIRKQLKRRYQRMRQGAIDEELFDVLSGYELLRRGGTSGG